MDKHKEIPLQRHTDGQEQVGEQQNDKRQNLEIDECYRRGV